MENSKNERRAAAWSPLQPLLDAPAEEYLKEERFDIPAQPTLPFIVPFAPKPQSGPALSEFSALEWGAASAAIWETIADLEVSTQRLTLKLRLAALMAKRKKNKQ